METRSSFTKVILLVEDNEDDIALTIRALNKNNLANDLVVVRDGAEALDYLFARGEFAGRDPSDLPQLVLLDLKLPKLGGLEVLKTLRSDSATRYVPVVVLTSSDEEDDMIRSYDGGANSFVQKPVNFDDFVEAARQLGLYWLLINRTPEIGP
ncbi:MAG: response regulator [Blastocatellia bacterium]|nr:response regulator [Blastocatellia bacterium]